MCKPCLLAHATPPSRFRSTNVRKAAALTSAVNVEDAFAVQKVTLTLTQPQPQLQQDTDTDTDPDPDPKLNPNPNPNP